MRNAETPKAESRKPRQRNVGTPRRLAATRRGARFLPLAELLSLGCLILLLAYLPVLADGVGDEKGKSDKPIEMKPTEIGVRFTPRMADAIGKEFVKQMKDRYELDDDQVNDIQQIVSTQFMKVVTENAELGRNLIEHMISSFIENEGSFSKESAQEFGKMAKPLSPALRGFFTETAGKIGKRMTLKQRLKFTGDAAAATAGLVIFENRMKRWGEGKVSDGARPFFDHGDDEYAEEDSEPLDPNETLEHRRARKNVERWIEWHIDVDKQWEEYLKRAIAYYAFGEAQTTSADAILKDCRERIGRLKTPGLRAALVENRVARNLGWKLDDEIRAGPWMRAIEIEYEKLRKPLIDLDKEFKRRIDDVPTSEQRVAAKQRVQKLLTEKHVKKPQ